MPIIIIIIIIIICPHNQSNKDHYKKSEPDVSSGVLVKWAKKHQWLKLIHDTEYTKVLKIEANG